jgi:tetratricopeptide (TPR) repeat protein
MFRVINTIFACLFALYCNAAGLTIEPRLKASARESIGYMIDCRYSQAFRIADSLVASDSKEPIGYVLQMFSYGLRILDYNDFNDSIGLLNTYNQASRVIAEYEKVHGRSSFSLTMGGFTKATHASFYLQQKKYFSAISTGLDALSLFSKAKEKDADNYDVDFFLGMYDYAKSELRKKLWMVMFWYPGDKNAGREKLQRCSNGAEISGDAARLSLLDIYIQEAKYSQAEQLIDTLLRQYPGSRFVFWSQAKLFETRKNFDSAADVYGRMALSYEADPDGVYNGMFTRLRQMDCLIKADKKELAQTIGRAVLARCPEKTKQRYVEVFKKIEAITLQN